jgi:hypothetical protein
MAFKELLFAFTVIVPALPAVAAQPETTAPDEGAPPASPDARYCLRVDPITGTRIESIRCETREGWAQLDVDLDKAWPTDGVRVIGT